MAKRSFNLKIAEAVAKKEMQARKEATLKEAIMHQAKKTLGNSGFYRENGVDKRSNDAISSVIVKTGTVQGLFETADSMTESERIVVENIIVSTAAKELAKSRKEYDGGKSYIANYEDNKVSGKVFTSSYLEDEGTVTINKPTLDFYTDIIESGADMSCVESLKQIATISQFMSRLSEIFLDIQSIPDDLKSPGHSVIDRGFNFPIVDGARVRASVSYDEGFVVDTEVKGEKYAELILETHLAKAVNLLVNRINEEGTIANDLPEALRDVDSVDASTIQWLNDATDKEVSLNRQCAVEEAIALNYLAKDCAKRIAVLSEAYKYQAKDEEQERNEAISSNLALLSKVRKALREMFINLADKREFTNDEKKYLIDCMNSYTVTNDEDGNRSIEYNMFATADACFDPIAQVLAGDTYNDVLIKLSKQDQKRVDEILDTCDDDEVMTWLTRGIDFINKIITPETSFTGKAVIKYDEITGDQGMFMRKFIDVPVGKNIYVDMPELIIPSYISVEQLDDNDMLDSDGNVKINGYGLAADDTEKRELSKIILKESFEAYEFNEVGDVVDGLEIISVEFVDGICAIYEYETV